jgi:hypothetical protein
MNHQIRILAEQIYGSQVTNQEQKFAELIVHECMEVVSKKCASPTAYNALVEHFYGEEE